MTFNSISGRFALLTIVFVVLAELFIVSGVEFAAEGEDAELSAEVLPADGEKCPRCWNYRKLCGNPRHADVCERCGDVLDAIGFPDAEA